jgi:hypothetical protein
MKLEISLGDVEELTASVEITTDDLASHFLQLAANLHDTISEATPERREHEKGAINRSVASCLTAVIHTLEAIPDELIASSPPALVKAVTQRLHTQTERWRTVAIHNLTPTEPTNPTE